MLAEGISDRFTRFVPSDQFSSMNSYDITGVGLNLSTAAELEGKTDIKATRVILFSPSPHAHTTTTAPIHMHCKIHSFSTTSHCSPRTTTNLTIVLETIRLHIG